DPIPTPFFNDLLVKAVNQTFEKSSFVHLTGNFNVFVTKKGELVNFCGDWDLYATLKGLLKRIGLIVLNNSSETILFTHYDIKINCTPKCIDLILMSPSLIN